MPDVEFEEDTTLLMRTRNYTPQLSGMALFLKKSGIAQTENQAYGFMIGIMIFCIVIAGLIIYFFLVPHPSKTILVNPNLPAALQNDTTPKTNR
jgi:hypothetical protein